MKTSKLTKFSASKLSTKEKAAIKGGTIREGGRTVGAGQVTEIIE